MKWLLNARQGMKEIYRNIANEVGISVEYLTNTKQLDLLEQFAKRVVAQEREWVGLSHEEKEFYKGLGFVGTDIIEAKLKEKNT